MIKITRLRLTLGAAMLVVAASALVVRAFTPMSAPEAVDRARNLILEEANHVDVNGRPCSNFAVSDACRPTRVHEDEKAWHVFFLGHPELRHHVVVHKLGEFEHIIANDPPE